MALLSKAQINAATDRKWEDVPVPEWGGDVRIMELSAADRGYIEAGQIAAREKGSFTLRMDSLKVAREKLLALALVDENFERLYSNKEIAELGLKSSGVMTRLYDIAMKLSGMDGSAVEDAEGNSDAAPSGSSDSD